MNTREPIRRAELTEHDLQQVTGGAVAGESIDRDQSF